MALSTLSSTPDTGLFHPVTLAGSHERIELAQDNLEAGLDAVLLMKREETLPYVLGLGDGNTMNISIEVLDIFPPTRFGDQTYINVSLTVDGHTYEVVPVNLSEEMTLHWQQPVQEGMLSSSLSLGRLTTIHQDVCGFVFFGSPEIMSTVVQAMDVERPEREP